MNVGRWNTIWREVEEGRYQHVINKLQNILPHDPEFFYRSRILFEIYARQAQLTRFEKEIIRLAHLPHDRFTQLFNLLLLLRAKIQLNPSDLQFSSISVYEDEIWNLSDARSPYLRAMLYRLYSDYWHYLEDDFFTSLHYILEAEKIYRGLREQYEVFYTLNKIGILYRDAGNISLAKNSFKSNISLAEKIKSKRGVVISRGNLADLMLQKGNLDSALNELRQILDVIQEYGDNYNYGITCAKIAYIHYLRGDYQHAIDILNISDEFLSEFPKQRTSNFILLARILIQLRRFNGAEVELRLALEICDEYGYRELMASVINQLIPVLLKENRTHEIDLYLKILMDIAEEKVNQKIYALYLLSKAEVIFANEEDKSLAESLLLELLDMGLQDKTIILESNINLVILYLNLLEEKMEDEVLQKLEQRLIALDEIIQIYSFPIIDSQIRLLHAQLDIVRGRYGVAHRTLENLEFQDELPETMRERIAVCKKVLSCREMDGMSDHPLQPSQEEIKGILVYIHDMSKILRDVRTYIETD